MKFLLIILVMNSAGIPTNEFRFDTVGYDQCMKRGQNVSLQLNEIFKKHKKTVIFDCEDVEVDE